MRILHVIPSLSIGGAEKLLVDSLKLYTERNIVVGLLLIKETDSLLFDMLDHKDINIHILNRTSFYNPSLIFKIGKILKKYNLVHVHLFPSLYFVPLAKLLKRLKLPLVYTEHSTNNKRRNKRYLDILETFIYNRYRKIITISPEVDEALKNHVNIPSNRITLIPNGIDIKRYQDANSYEKKMFFEDVDAKILIQVSSFRYPKDQQTIVRALKLLPDNVKLLLVGEGPLVDQVKLLVSQLELSNRVLFLGVRMDVPELLKTSDIIILSSAYEGLSLASLEALSSGRPFLASDVRGIRETVLGFGILFEYQNENQLADNIKLLLSDKEYYNQTSLKCMDRASNYSLEKMVDSYIKIYKEILNNE